MAVTKSTPLDMLKPFDLCSRQEASDRIGKIAQQYQRNVKASEGDSGVRGARLSLLRIAETAAEHRRALLRVAETAAEHRRALSEADPNAIWLMKVEKGDDLPAHAGADDFPDPLLQQNRGAEVLRLEAREKLARDRAANLPPDKRTRPKRLGDAKLWLTLDCFTLFAACRVSQFHPNTKSVRGFEKFVSTMMRYASEGTEGGGRSASLYVRRVLNAEGLGKTPRQAARAWAKEWREMLSNDAPAIAKLKKGEILQRIEDFATLRGSTLSSFDSDPL